MTREIVGVGLALVGLASVPAFGQATVPVPTLAPPKSVISLHRPHADWKVVTTITLAIEPLTGTGKPTFRWTDPQHGTIDCQNQSQPGHEVTLDPGTVSITCSYEPTVGFAGADRFSYDAKFEGGAYSPQAVVPIDVRERGIRWEFKTAGSTITSDAPDPKALAGVPEILGGTSQDFLFTVNAQIMRPSQPLANKPLARASRQLQQADLKIEKARFSQSANFLVETGVQTDAVAATVTDVGQSVTTSESGGSGTGTTSENAVARRNLVLRGEFNYNAAADADGVGRFVEIGAVGKASFISVLDSNESFKEAVGRVLQVVPKDRSATKVDGGIRLAIKQPHELNTTTIVKSNGEIEPPTNIENALLLEAMWRFDTSLEGLATDTGGGDSRKRWVVRAEFTPEITALPGHELGAIGIEISRAFGGGPPAVKVTYGMNLSASKGIFKTRD